MKSKAEVIQEVLHFLYPSKPPVNYYDVVKLYDLLCGLDYESDDYQRLECSDEDFKLLAYVEMQTDMLSTFDDVDPVWCYSTQKWVDVHNYQVAIGAELERLLKAISGRGYYYKHKSEMPYLFNESKMKVLAIDIETYSSNDIKAGGVYKYVDAKDFAILLFAFACDDEPVQIIDLASGEDIPENIASALVDNEILKTAFNAAFERICLSKYLGVKLPVAQWECTMVRSAMLGFPLSLGEVGKVLSLQEGKMDEGKALIRYFSIPCKPTKTNGNRSRNLPEHAPDKWQTFKEYCVRDVEVERSIRNKTAFFGIPQGEKELYIVDQNINDRGVEVDTVLIENAMQINEDYKLRLSAEASELTGLDNPNSVSQLKDWLEEETGEKIESLNKEAVNDLLSRLPAEEVERVLRIRQENSKSSVEKYSAMQRALCTDGRVHGLLQFYGANRTGRWAGRLVQVQNLPQNHLEDLDLARQTVRSNDPELLEVLYGNVPDVLSQLIRTAFVAKEGGVFLVADFSAIEARVIAWLADETWRQEVFKTHGKIYEASASQMFHVPIDSIHKGDALRQRGKVAELALGYQGGVGALTRMDIKKAIPEEEKQGIVDAWRKASPNIVNLWYEVQNAAMKAIEEGTSVTIRHGIRFEKRGSFLFILLPSGRRLSYVHAQIGTNRFGSSSVCYWGVNQTTRKWEQMETYGGKLVENIVQAIARDCLAESIKRLEAKGYKIVFHVHDEVIIETCDDGKLNLAEACEIMGKPIEWAPGLLLRADGYETYYYRKD